MAKAQKTSPDKPKVADLNQADIAASKPASDAQDEVSFSDLGPRRSYRWIGFVIAAIIIAAALLGGFKVVYGQKIYPGVSVNGVYLGGLSRAEAQQELTQAGSTYQKSQILVHYADTTQAIDLAKIKVTYDIDTAVAGAYRHGRTGGWGDQLLQIGRGLVNRPTRLSQVNFDVTKLQPYLEMFSAALDTPVANASFNFSDTGRVGVLPDQVGRRLDAGRLIADLEQRLARGSNDDITAPLDRLDPTITTADLLALKGQADNYLQGPLTLKFAGLSQTAVVQVKDMIGWLKLDQPSVQPLSPQLSLTDLGYWRGDDPISLSLDETPIAAYVAKLAKSVDQPGQNAALTITNDVATVFLPEKTGYTLEQPAAVTAIKAALTKPSNDRVIALSVKVTEPAVTAASLNSLGINQLISEGVTTFPGSPSARMQNIRVGAAKFNGVLVKPDEVFSFESLLGNVDAAAGYAPALVILGDHEEYQYGGGMCQVSSTAYRAALLAGLPIVERHSHSFAVGYYTAPYGVPGVDATVFDASIDLKFKNDTGHYILIQTVLQGTTLKFDFYGTKTKTGVIHPPTFIDPPGGAGWNATKPSTTVFTRDILDLAGNVIKTDTIKTHYKSSLDFPVVKELN